MSSGNVTLHPFNSGGAGYREPALSERSESNGRHLLIFPVR